MSRKFDHAVHAVLAIIGVVVLLGYLALAIVHLTTLYDINQTSGAWLSFAYYVRNGVLYPPLNESGYYAGTRYMPGFFSVHAALSMLTGEFLASGKLLTALSAVGIVAALRHVVFEATRKPLIALAAAAVFLATFVGHKASLTIRGDVLPLAMSLLSLVLLDRSGRDARNPPSTRLLLASAVLAGLPPLVKFTSFHALAAGFLFLVRYDRKRAFSYAFTSAAVFAVGIAAIEILSEGRFHENLHAAAVAGSNKRTFIEAMSVYFYWLKLDRGFFLLLLLVPLAFLRRTKAPYVDLWRIYFLLHLCITSGFFFDTGAEYNHLVDLLAATIILAGEVLGSEDVRLRALAATAFILAGAFGLVTYQIPAWTAPERGMKASRLFAEEMGLAGKHFLTHDPTVAVLMGQRPLVADDFQFRVLVAKGIVQVHELPERITRKEFDRIVLLNGFDAPSSDPSYYRDREFGPFVARVIRENYELEKKVYKYYIYRPK